MNKNTRDKFKSIRELLLNKRSLIPQPLQLKEDCSNSFKELNIAVLESDLRTIKNNASLLNRSSIRKLDIYFDKICLYLEYNPGIFKNFIRKLFKENNKQEEVSE